MLCHQFLSWHMHTARGQNVFCSDPRQLGTHHQLPQAGCNNQNHNPPCAHHAGPACHALATRHDVTHDIKQPPDLNETTQNHIPTNPQPCAHLDNRACRT